MYANNIDSRLSETLANAMSKTLYDLLEVGPSASQEVIVGAYTTLHARLSLSFGNSSALDRATLAQLRALREAYNVLSDPERRQSYDLDLAAGTPAILSLVENRPRFAWAFLLLAGCIGLGAAGYARFSADLDKARQEREMVATQARLADVQLQQEREAWRTAARADAQHRLHEAMERYNQELAMIQGGQTARETSPGSPGIGAL